MLIIGGWLSRALLATSLGWWFPKWRWLSTKIMKWRRGSSNLPLGLKDRGCWTLKMDEHGTMICLWAGIYSFEFAYRNHQQDEKNRLINNTKASQSFFDMPRLASGFPSSACRGWSQPHTSCLCRPAVSQQMDSQRNGEHTHADLWPYGMYIYI